jgi:hypothetical protein
MADNNQNMDPRQSKFEQRLVGSRSNAITWAALFLWGAISLILDTMDFTHNNPNWDAGTIFFLGAGAILVISALAVLSGPSPHRRVGFRFILGLVFLGVGLGHVTNINENEVVAAILVLIAAGILWRAFGRKI